MKIIIVSMEFARAQRMRSLAEGLSAAGHDVTLLTAEQDAACADYRVISIPFESAGSKAKAMIGIAPSQNAAEIAATRGRMAESLVRALARLNDEYLRFPDKYDRWLRACREWLQAHGHLLRDVDWVVASMPPVTALYVGIEVAQHAGARLLMDFRDLWVDNPYYEYGPWRRRRDLRAERALLEHAAAATVATKPLELQMRGKYPDLDSHAVYTGIEAAEWLQHVWRRDEHHLRFGHIGITYGGKRDVRPFLDALLRLNARDLLDLSRVRVEMIGEADAEAIASTQALGLSDVVAFRGPIPRADVPAAIAEIDVALLLMWPEDESAFPLKSRHYLAAGKTIIVVGASPESDVARLMTGLPGVTVCISEEALNRAILDAWDNWLAGADFSWAGRREFAFSREEMTSDFLEVMASADAVR